MNQPPNPCVCLLLLSRCKGLDSHPTAAVFLKILKEVKKGKCSPIPQARQEQERRALTVRTATAADRQSPAAPGSQTSGQGSASALAARARRNSARLRPGRTHRPAAPAGPGPGRPGVASASGFETAAPAGPPRAFRTESQLDFFLE